MKKGQQKLAENNGVVDNDQVTSTVEDSQDAASKETSQIETDKNDTDNINTEVSNSSPMPADSSDSTQLSSKEKLAKFSFEHKAQ